MELTELIEMIDIVEYISQFVDLEERNGEYWGLSPFKDERTPSFSVRRETNNFYDFSSGIGGNVFTFVKQYNRCSAAKAVDILKEYAGLGEQEIPSRKKLTATVVCGKFKRPEHRKKAPPVKVYPQNYMERYATNPDKLAIWEAEGISKSALKRFQVSYDEFSDRLVYPIRNLSGQIVNIGGRTLDANWKEKRLRKYTYYSKWGEMDVIYGLFENMDFILDKQEVILFEGCKSVLLADSWGIHNTGALLTSHLNPNQLQILIKLGVRVVFALDKEVKIKDDHNIRKLRRYTSVEYLWDRDNLLDAKDAPVDKGLEVFQILYGQRFRFLY